MGKIFIHRLTIFEILFELEDLSDNVLNCLQIYRILPLNGFYTDQDSDKSDNEHEDNHMWRTNKGSFETTCLTGTAY